MRAPYKTRHFPHYPEAYGAGQGFARFEAAKPVMARDDVDRGFLGCLAPVRDGGDSILEPTRRGEGCCVAAWTRMGQVVVEDPR